ncbi:MAG: universal stress protein, partial [Flavicella sp.]
MHTFEKILIGVAFSPNLKENIFEAIRLSNMFNAQLVCVHVGEETAEKRKKLTSIIEEGPNPTKPI